MQDIQLSSVCAWHPVNMFKQSDVEIHQAVELKIKKKSLLILM